MKELIELLEKAQQISVELKLESIDEQLEMILHELDDLE